LDESGYTFVQNNFPSAIPMLEYALQLDADDRDLLPLTNAGAYIETLSTSGRTLVISTADPAVFARWSRALAAAGRPVQRLT
jgi:hypothetical protein